MMKYKVGQYEVCVSFKSENVMKVFAEFVPTEEYFECESAELTKIKKETVIAALEKKSEKHLRCEVDNLGTKLKIKFIVNYDFLPEFSEEIELDLVEKKEKLKSMQIYNFRAEIENINETLDSLNEGTTKLMEIPSFVSGGNFSKAEFKKIKVSRGKYLIRFTGSYTNSSGGAQLDTLTVHITSSLENQSIKRQACLYSISGYSYPFELSEIIETNNGDIIFEVESNQASYTITNGIIEVNSISVSA